MCEDPITQGRKQQVFIVLRCSGSGSQAQLLWSPLAQGLSQGRSQGGGPTSKPTRLLIGQIRFFARDWTRSLSASLGFSPCSGFVGQLASL